MHWIRIRRYCTCLAALLGLTSASLPTAPTAWTASAASAAPRGLQIFDPFVTSTLPVGTGISVQLLGGKTSSGVDQLDLLVGEVLLGISLSLPQGYFFNVDQARVRIVFAYLTQSEARSGECAPDQLGPVSNQVVQSPLSARFGAAAEQALGTSTVNVNLADGVTFIKGGDYRLCFSDDGSFASGHADLLNVLIRVDAFVTTRLPAGSGVTFVFSDGEEQSANDGENITVSAGQPIVRISLQLPILSIFDAGNVRLKAINASVTRQEVLDGACAPGSLLELNTQVLDSPLSDSLGVETLHSKGTYVANTSAWALPVRFNSAGRVRLCYSDDGSFSTGHVDLISVVVTAEGIFSSCEEAGCLAARTFRCHALLGIPSALGSCEVPILGVLGSLGYISWSERIDGVYSGNGEPLPFHVPLCSASVADPNAFCVADCEGNRSFSLNSAVSVVMPPTAPLAIAREARTTAVCYCTGLNGCDMETGQGNFFQPLGLVQLFTASVMPIGEFACATSSSGILASIPFGACVFCPAGGCPFQGASRILFTRQPAPWNAQAYPAWHPQHRCRDAVHEAFLLPEASIAALLDGGPRSDLKRFRPTEGYTLPNWPTFVPRGNWLDICFNPDVNSNETDWFKVGEVAVLDASLGSSSTVPSYIGSTPPKQVGQVGQISMSRSLLPYRNPENVVGLTTGGGIRLAEFVITEDSSTREACEKSRPLQVTGLTRANASEYSGTVRGDVVVFDGGILGKSISFPTVGTAVVCYCPNLGGLDEFGEQTCLGSPYWVPVGAIVIAGPLPNQYWLLPTLKTFRFEYLGLNLEDGDMLRLILESGSCAAFTAPERLCLRTNEDPMNGHPLCESTLLTANTGLMQTTTLADSRVRCDELNENCGSVPLRSVEATSSGLRLTFAGSTSSGGGLGELGLRTGDTIVLGAGVQCGGNCSQPMLDMAKGFLGFQGLESYLPLDDDAPITAVDVVGSRSGTYTGTVQSIAGKWGSYGTRFSTGASLSLPDGAPMEVSQAWSLVLWLRTEKAGWYTICGVADANGVLEDGEVEIGLATAPWLDGAPFLHQENGPGADAQVMAGRVVTPGEWTHVAVVYGGSMSGTLRFYVDGDLSYERLGVALNMASLPLQCAGRVSASPPSGTASDGYLDLDEIKWYNVPLTSEDVGALFNATDGGVADAQQAPGAPIGIAVEATDDPAVFNVATGSFATAPVPPEFKVDATGGQWRRGNRGVIRGELMSSYERRLKVCWERGGRAADAGVVEFVAQSSMTELGIWPTQREWSKSSPFILTFKTGKADSQGLRYTKAEGHMSLTITYLNQAAIRHMGSSAQGPFVSSFNLESDERHEASQSVCGIIFRELWSSDPARGFPLPYGCFYRSLTTDMREITVIFEKRNGLSPDTSYQIVMNAAATNEMVADQELFFISSNDDYEGYRYAALEVGHVFSSQETLYQLGAGNNDPQFAPDIGLDIVGGDETTNLVTLQDGSTRLQLQMMGGQYSTAKISRGNLLSVWVEPLTAWQLPTSCGDQTDLSVAAGSIRIHCFVILGTFRRCGEVARCSGKPVVPFATQVPQIEIEMPPNMNDLFGPLVYEMDIYSFRLPAQGALPHRLMVQIMKDDATKPHFRVATGRFYNAPTREFATIGRVLTSPQNGLEPFEGVQSHVLYVMLQMAVPLRGFDRSRPPPDVRPDSYFVIQAPSGFRMLEAVPVVHEGAGLGKVTLSPEGDAASRLNDTIQPAPTGFGTPDLGGWSFLGGEATYKLLDRSLIPAMTSLVMGLRVYPGNTSLPITNTLNLWSVQVFSPGDHNETMVNFTAKFYRTGLGGVPVLGRLQNALIQPVDPMVSREVATIQPLSIFFKAVEDVPAGGSIDVEASRVFDFGEQCGAVDLDDGYYVTGPVPAVHRLPRIVSCTSYRDSGQTAGPYNIARIFVEGPLKGINIYGFSIPVRNPTLQEVSQILSMTDPWSDVDWNLTTRGPEGSPVCATYGGAPGAPDGTGSWRLVNKSIPPKASVSDALAINGPAVAVTLTNWLPFALTQVASHATMVFMLDVDFSGFLEISAPVGFEWLSALVTSQPQAPYNETHSFEDLPQVSPSSQGAMLQFVEGQYRAGVRYGFQAPLYVPDVGPVTSLSAFYISLLVANPLGPALPEGISSVVFAEPVRAIVDSMARSSNKLPGTTAELMLKLRIATAVPDPSYLQITMPPGYGPLPSGDCGKRPWPGQLDFSGMEPLEMATCGFQRSVGAISYLGQQYDVFHIMIRPSATMPLMPGLLQFRMDITNPPAELSAFYTDNEPAPGARICGAACWSFSTMMSDGLLIDAPQTVPSEPPPSEMALGEIMAIWPAGRNDRPSKSSRLIFRFSLGIDGPFNTGDPMPAGQMELVGPPGTVIPTRCYHLVETRVVNLFGSIFNASQLGVDVWDPNSPVTGCEGNGETAVISLSPGLIASNTYAFRIDIVNPPSQTSSNFWTMTLLDHFAKPIPSFPLWAFPEISVSTFARNSAPSCYLGDCVGAGGIAIPIQLQLRTQNTVKTGGELRILAPLEFGFDPDDAPLIQGDKQTRCLINEYENFDLSSLPYTWRMAERYCLIADRGNPLDGSGTGDTRTVRVITRYQQNPFDLRPPKTFHPNATFVLYFWMHPPNTFRPSEAWHLESFSPAGEELDIGTAMGWEVIRVMNLFEHSNTGGVNQYTQTISPAVTQGLAIIPNFVIDFVLPANGWLADKLVLTAPKNFEMQLPFMDANAPGSCIDRTLLLPLGVAVLEPEATRSAICMAEVMTLPARDFGRALQSGDLCRLLIRLRNPESPPPPEYNYWKLEHVAGSGSKEVQSSAIADSWVVVPVISNVSSGITGILRGAGSRTTIYFNFTVVQSASELQIDALEPIGFEFQDSYAYANISQRGNSSVRRSVPQILLATWDAFRLVILADAFDNIHLTITDVKISEVPGASQWRLSTWELPEDDKEGTPYIRDEAYVQGFLVPGQLQVFNAFGQTGRENAAILGRESDLFFDMTSSAAIPAGSDLLVRAGGAGPAGFKLFSETAELWTLNSVTGAVETKLGEWYCTGMRNLFDPENETAMNLTKEMYLPHPAACEWDETRREMLNSFDKSDPTAERIAHVVVLKITTGAAVHSPLRLKFKVQSPTDRTTFLQERWHIDIELVNRTNGMVNLVTTNDGDPVPLSVVTQLPTEPPPEPSHVAPLTRVEVVIPLDPLDTGAEAFTLTAPPGYSFVHPCKVPFQENKTNNVDEMRCFPLAPLNGRSRAKVDCEADRSETNAKGLGTECFREAPAVIYISTPEASIPPAENVWFVEAVDGTNSSGDRIGRGTLAGFDIENMDVQVIYGSLASVPVDIGVVFTSRVDVPAQGKVMIKGPPDLQQFGCENKRGTVKSGSLGAITRCQTSVNPPRVTLTLNETLKAGLHLVILPGETPRQNPEESLNTFDVFLRMPDDRNLDVSLKVPGEPVQQGLRASVLSFWWTQLLQYDTAFYVTVPIEILDDVDIPLWGILIDFPKEPDFQLDSTDIQASRSFGESLYLSPFQAQAGDSQLLVRLDKTRRLRTGLTLIRFPITRPEQLPVFNFWRIAFCGDQMGENGEGCTLGEPRTERGPAVISVFANGGFDPLEPSSPLEDLKITTGSGQRCEVSFWLLMWSCMWRCLQGTIGELGM